jgi:hypothetical protein
MGYFKHIYTLIQNIEKVLPKSKVGLVGMEIELNSGIKTTIKGWNYNRESKVLLTLTNGNVLLLESLPIPTLEKIESIL